MSARIGYHISHEQFAPSHLLRLTRRAEQAGFQELLSSDHFHPWTPEQGQSGHAFTWLAAAMASCHVGAGVVTSPGQRMHPALVAQMLATLAELYPGRIWAALGTGQALNECITGQGWPSKDLRRQRLRECVDVMRALWAGQEITHRGLVVVEQAKLYTLPEQPPRLFGAAMTPSAASWVAAWADGLITVSQPRDALRAVVDAFRRGGGEHKPMYLKVQLSFAQDDARATRGAHEQWAGNVYPSSVLADLRSPAQFQALAETTSSSELARHVRISSDVDRQIDWLREDLTLGFERLYLHNVNREQEAFVDAFGAQVLPALQVPRGRGL